jgi:hypothetical protein
MKKLLRISIVILLLVVAAAVVYTQAQIYAPPLHPSPAAMMQLPAVKPSEVAAPIPRAPASAPISMLGTEASPVIVRLAETPESDSQSAEREKDREIQRGILHYNARLAATSLAQTFLMLFQAIIYFLTLIVLFGLLENVRKFANAAGKSAEAAKKSAEMAEAAVAKRNEKRFGPRKFPPHFYRKR